MSEKEQNTSTEQQPEVEVIRGGDLKRADFKVVSESEAAAARTRQNDSTNQEAIQSTTAVTQAPPAASTQAPAAPFDELIAQRTQGAFKSLDEVLAAATAPRPAAKPNYKDNWIKAVVKAYNEDQDITPYLDAKRLDLDKMADEDVLRFAMRRNNPRLDSEDIDLLLDKKKRDYGFGDDADERQLRLAKAMLSEEASRLRGALNAELNPYRNPEVADDEPDAVDPAGQYETMLNNWRQRVDASNVFDKIKDGRLTMPFADEPFSYQLPYSVDQVRNLMYRPDEFFNLFVTQDANGNPGTDYEKLLYTVLLAQNPQGVLDLVYKHGRNVGAAQVLERPTNPQMPAGKAPTNASLDTSDEGDVTAEDLAAAFKKAWRS